MPKTKKRKSAKSKALKTLKKKLQRKVMKKPKPAVKLVSKTPYQRSKPVGSKKFAVKKPETITLVFSAEDLHQAAIALSPCISTEETRYYLHGIAIDNDPGDPQAFRFVATDGHKLGVYVKKHMLTGKKPVRFHGIIDREAVQYFASIKLKHYTHFKLEAQGFHLTVHAYDGTSIRETRRFQLIDGSFPDWERCLPTKTETPRQAFRARYLADIGKAVHALSGAKGKHSEYPSVAIGENGNNSRGPAWLLTDIEGLRYVIMPQTSGSTLPQAPKLEDRPALQQLQAISTLLWQIKLTPYPELTGKQREIDDILSRMIDTLKSKKSA